MSLAAPFAPTLKLLRREPRARGFFLAHAQSSLGNGAAYVALLVLAYERLHSPWAITLILLADMLPPMLLGPLCGAAADRWPRRRCAVVADAVRAFAFVGIGLIGGFVPMLALALLAGTGTALFRPAVLAGLPGLVDKSRLPAATSLYGAIDDLGYTLGPVLAGGLLLLAGADTVMVANGLTFVVSALVLARSPLGDKQATAVEPSGTSLVSEAREGLRVVASSRVLKGLIAASSSILLFAGLFNVGELLLAEDTLGAGSSGYAVLVAVFGIGVAAGSMSGSKGGSLDEITGRFLGGLLLVAAAFVASGLAPTYGVALVAFAACGVGNGVVMVHERLLLQELVHDQLMGRVFGIKDALTSGAFGAGFVCAGVLLPLIGTRALFVLAGVGALAVWCAAALLLRPAAAPAPMVATAEA
jgi:MFS family permease